jgi:DNA (cytosine-5)-methyltransferase 1
MARIIGEVRPRYAFVENSPMLTSRGLGTVLGDLAALGFDARWGVVSAADVGAPHLRERIWIRAEQRNFLAHSKHSGIGRGQQWSESTQETHESMANGNSDSQSISAINAEQVCKTNIPDTDNWRRGRREISGEGGNGRSEFYGENKQMADTGYERVCQQGISNDVGEDDELPRGIQPDGLSVRGFNEGKDMADTNRAGCQEQWGGVANGSQHKTVERGSGWSVEPDVGRVANGVAARVDRLKAIGNGQVPAVAATAFRLLSKNL